MSLDCDYINEILDWMGFLEITPTVYNKLLYDGDPLGLIIRLLNIVCTVHSENKTLVVCFDQSKFTGLIRI